MTSFRCYTSTFGIPHPFRNRPSPPRWDENLWSESWTAICRHSWLCVPSCNDNIPTKFLSEIVVSTTFWANPKIRTTQQPLTHFRRNCSKFQSSRFLQIYTHPMYFSKLHSYYSTSRFGGISGDWNVIQTMITCQSSLLSEINVFSHLFYLINTPYPFLILKCTALEVSGILETTFSRCFFPQLWSQQVPSCIPPRDPRNSSFEEPFSTVVQ